MRMHIDLSAGWRRLAAKGLIRNEFVDRDGRRIEGGVRSGPDGAEAYAVDLATGRSVCDPPSLTRLSNGMDLLFNPVGGLKPYTRPSASGRQPDLPEDAASCAFRCQDADSAHSMIRRDSLLQVTLAHFAWRALPNLAPWEHRGLLVWVPWVSGTGPLPHIPQRMTFEALDDFLEIARASEGFSTFFNSLHGGASANHLHFQSAYYGQELAAENAPRVAHGCYTMLDRYPACGLVFPRDTPAAGLWDAVRKIQHAGYPFNLIALNRGIYLFVRRPEHEVVDEFPGRAFGAINFAGLFISSDPVEMSHVNEAALAAAYEKMTLDAGSLRRLLLS